MKISFSFFLLFLALILSSCSENELAEEFTPILNDTSTIINDTSTITCEEFTTQLNDTLKITGAYTDLYNYDLDLDEENDIEISVHFYIGIGGSHYFVNIYTLQDNWSISSESKTTFLCRDTLYLGNDTTWAYYNTYNCIDSAVAIDQHTDEVAQLYSDEDLDNIEISQTAKNELIIHHYDGRGSDQVRPDAKFTDITKTIFEDRLIGWLIFEKNNSELYGLKIEIQGSQYSPKTIYCHESKRLDCE